MTTLSLAVLRTVDRPARLPVPALDVADVSLDAATWHAIRSASTEIVRRAAAMRRVRTNRLATDHGPAIEADGTASTTSMAIFIPEPVPIARAYGSRLVTTSDRSGPRRSASDRASSDRSRASTLVAGRAAAGRSGRATSRTAAMAAIGGGPVIGGLAAGGRGAALRLRAGAIACGGRQRSAPRAAASG